MKKLVAVLAAGAILLSSCASAPDRVTKDICTVSHKDSQSVDTYQCGTLKVKDEALWATLTVETEYEFVILDGVVLDSDIRGNHQTNSLKDRNDA